jgi:hypothetical protein
LPNDNDKDLKLNESRVFERVKNEQRER